MSEQKPLRLEEGTIEEIVGICDEMLAKLDQRIVDASELGSVSGFGGFESAQQLAEGYRRKGVDGPDSVLGRLVQFREAIEAMRAAFVGGGEAFADQDSAVMQQITTISQGFAS
ncbi:hypothetical protein G4H71_02975 [Rhodococcus triatomae]|uniref:Excreted virulence factor EspC, type VII ESX diderm n=1 Tax=Rhodococcus triatomae TaxID=300028 RepID=A0A1G8M4S7_9NOCA|nr:hypothetical protein [Rhodococcus triatomae]QNG18195.1 hypothetical protein G4H72_05065 [Rhodococcus triatomae]QNG22134.1 hypothetical protein G4H71_02975 [Rhodococcus triatomae]SDI62934.1 hypothetical protein SAMN05444695_109105 [Rhodococcus triatomae]